MDKFLLLPLIRNSLLSQSVEIDLYKNFTLENWQELREYAIAQGVIAIAFDGIIQSGIKIPKQELMRWYGFAEITKQKRQEHISGIKAMKRVMKQVDADMLVFKGLSLAKYYPNPGTREFGDIDTFTLFDKLDEMSILHDKVNDFVKNQGIEIEYREKHDIFSIANSTIEHHRIFVNESSGLGKFTNQTLYSLLLKDKGKKIAEHVYYPSANFYAIYILYHILGHMAFEGATLKNVLDWGLFLLKDGDNVNWKFVKDYYTKSNFTKGFNTFTMMVGKILDVDLSKYYIGDPSEELSQKVYETIMDTVLHQEEGYILPKRIWKKYQRLLSHRWIYSSGLMPTNFWTDYFFRSLKEHILQPNQI